MHAVWLSALFFKNYGTGINADKKHIIATGVWQSRDELRELRQIDRVFEPRAHVCKVYDSILTLWNQALGRFLDWYDT
jgi:glycerol kinase